MVSFLGALGVLIAAPSKPRNFQWDTGQKENAQQQAEDGVLQ